MKRRILIAAPILAASALMLSACSVAQVVAPPFAGAIYATPADASGAPSNVALPDWVPADATLIRIKTDETKHASIMTFTVTTPAPIGQPCSADMSAQLPQLIESWWPPTVPAEGVTCSGAWHIFTPANYVYAWTP
ncbi:hypothetical protein KPL76_00555 [Subtercola sp. PAMC28395]|uniref:hypothetical protein n=1 Tax=Subtercola sp. PAMC28395 TaxID=2846775 RepID=UPI001C0CBDD9|nr:hypothetical protein [Subtercola sp. PAMC28395]QWT23978.1 hypothetical protein KPL76_00555 [Subtercola sp. PAMC28395]